MCPTIRKQVLDFRIIYSFSFAKLLTNCPANYFAMKSSLPRKTLGFVLDSTKWLSEFLNLEFKPEFRWLKKVVARILAHFFIWWHLVLKNPSACLGLGPAFSTTGCPENSAPTISSRDRSNQLLQLPQLPQLSQLMADVVFELKFSNLANKLAN